MSKIIEFKNFFVGNVYTKEEFERFPWFKGREHETDIYANGVVEIERDVISFHVDFNNVGLFFNCDLNEEWVAKAKQALYEIWADKHYIDGGLGYYVKEFPDRLVEPIVCPECNGNGYVDNPMYGVIDFRDDSMVDPCPLCECGYIANSRS